MNEDLKKVRDRIIAEDFARIDVMKDEDIDFSDIPEVTDEQWSRVVRGKFYRPLLERHAFRNNFNHAREVNDGSRATPATDA